MAPLAPEGRGDEVTLPERVSRYVLQRNSCCSAPQGAPQQNVNLVQ